METEMLSLRPYQGECLDAIWKAYREQGIQRAAVVLPTGSGKTVIFSHLADHWHAMKDGEYVTSGRVLILVHRDELIRQTVAKLEAVAPGLRVGVVKAKENDHVDRDVIVASVQTVKSLYRLDQITASGEIGLVIVDECHHAAAESYVTVLVALGCFAIGGPLAVGFTATLSRNDKKSLGDVWQEIVYRRDILDMIADKYLTDVRGRLVTVDGLSLSQVAMRGGDYAIGSLSEALLSADAPKFAADAWVEHASEDYGIVFTPSVETAQRFSDEFSARGITSAMVWGGMSPDARTEALRGAHEGRTRVLINCMVLTEGFDWPRARTVMIARPTTSAALYVQMVGRVLRPFPGKETALVLDIVGASQEHRLASLADLTSRRIQTMVEGESLTDAVRREKEARNPALADYAVSYEDVDLFQRSRATWLQTKGGIWFVSTKEQIYFVWPGSEPGLYRLGVRPVKGRGGRWLREDVTLELAMSWGSDMAIREDATLATRGRSWRRGYPTLAMTSFACRLGLKDQLHADIRKGEVSDMIDIVLASRVLDKKGK